ncbi:MAG TPA: site-specific integrase [Allosphingosinicella sp.]|nr:site-specific integrase [Allosphingosinicella sp.]
MTVYKPKRSSLFLYDFVMRGQRYSGPTGCKIKRDAERVEAKVRAEIALDTGSRKKPTITLDEAAGLYEDHLRGRGRWSPTADYIIAGLIESLGGDRYLSEISQQDLSDHFARRAAKVSASTVNREIDVARPIWRRLRKSHDIGEMPEWGQLSYAVPDRPPRELTHTEEAALLPEIRQDLYDFCDFALRTGWRKSEVMGLRWIDCDLNGATATTRIKGGNYVRRPLTQAMVVIIANQPRVGPFVFTYICQKSKSRYTDRRGRLQPARKKGERYPMTPTVLRKPWAAAKKAAGVEGFRFHDLRHTRLTRVLRSTQNLALAKRAGEHRNIKTTLRYAHVLDDDLRRGLEASESRTIPEAETATAEKVRKSANDAA